MQTTKDKRMNWEQLLSSDRLTATNAEKTPSSTERSPFQRDYDRLIFSAPFRRLQNKTQVFPIPGNIFVHNRLTHSLEVSCVGRSLGNNIAQFLQQKGELQHSPTAIYDIGTIISTACLAHDLGNPPFGHSGEAAISQYFSEGNGLKYQNRIPSETWSDLTHFEGNANTFRILTHSYSGRREGGFSLTCASLAATIKYPYEGKHAKKNGFKYGFFQNEKEAFIKVAETTGLLRNNATDLSYARHPLVFAVEAADDICYQIMDIEDAYKLKLLSEEKTHLLLLQFCDEKQKQHINQVFTYVTDKNEQIAYLRSVAINNLVEECSLVFERHYDEIMEGTFKYPLLQAPSNKYIDAYRICANTAHEQIYHTPSVTQIIIAGHQIFETILDTYIQAILTPENHYSANILRLMPQQYHIEPSASIEMKIRTVVDYLAGMTDSYALELYRTIKGIELPNFKHR